MDRLATATTSSSPKARGGASRPRPPAKRGVNLAKRFEKAGTYRFICTFHPAEMRLKLIVR